MSTAQHLSQPPSRLRSTRVIALVATAIVLAIAAGAVIVISASGDSASAPPAPHPAAVSSPHVASGPSRGLEQLVRAHVRNERGN